MSELMAETLSLKRMMAPNIYFPPALLGPLKEEPSQLKLLAAQSPDPNRGSFRLPEQPTSCRQPCNRLVSVRCGPSICRLHATNLPKPVGMNFSNRREAAPCNSEAANCTYSLRLR